MDAGAQTLNCVLPVDLTVQGSGFLTGIDSAQPFYVTRPSYWITPLPAFSAAAQQQNIRRPYGRALVTSPANDTYFVFQLVFLGTGVMDIGVPVNLSVSCGDTPVVATSAPFPAFSIAPFTQPDITGISGCPVEGADGKSTSLCLPDRDLLTVTGRGFLVWQEAPLQLVIGSTSTWFYLFLGAPSGPYASSLNGILNDSTILVTLSVAYRALLAAGDFGGPPQPFSIVQALTGVSTSVLQVQFAPLPLPYFTSIAPYSFDNVNPQCQWGPNRSTIVNCLAGGSGIRISGHYFYQLTVTIGGLPLTITPIAQQEVTLASLTTPLANYVPGQLYDLVLTAASGSVTMPSFISFSAAPAIVTAACKDPTLPTDIGTLGCQVGEMILMNGPNLPPSSTPFAVTIYSAYSRQNASCANPRYTSDTQLACDVLTPGQPSSTAWDTLYLQWATGLSLVLSNRFDAWDTPLAPRITSLSSTGCGGFDHTATVQLGTCSGGELLTFYGTNFLSEGFDMRMLPVTSSYYAVTNYWSQTVQCGGFSALSDSVATCELPIVDETAGLSYGVPLMLLMVNRTSYHRSNALFLTFEPQSPAAASSSGAAVSSTTIALCVVFGLLGAVGLVCLVWLLVRRRAKEARGSPTHSDAEQSGSERWWQLSSRASSRSHSVELSDA